MVPRSFPKQLSNQHPNLHRFWDQLGSIWGGFWEPSWSQVGTKSLQKWIQKATQQMITFWIAPRSIFGRFWLQLGSQEGVKNVLGFYTFSLLEPTWGHLGPKIAQDLSKTLFWNDPTGSCPPAWWIWGGFWSPSSRIFGLVCCQPLSKQARKQANNQPTNQPTNQTYMYAYAYIHMHMYIDAYLHIYI